MFLAIRNKTCFKWNRKMHNYNFLETKFHDLFILLEEFLTQSEKQECAVFFDAGEYGLTLETLCGILQDEKKSVPLEVLELIQKLGNYMFVDEELWTHLKVI